MPRMIYDYTKNALEKVSVDVQLFVKELRKASRVLLPYELERLKKWLLFFTENRPELRNYVILVLK